MLIGPLSPMCVAACVLPSPVQIQDIIRSQPRVYARLSQLEDLRTAMLESLTKYKRTAVVEHKVRPRPVADPWLVASGGDWLSSWHKPPAVA